MRICCALPATSLFPPLTTITRNSILFPNNNSLYQSKIYCQNSFITHTKHNNENEIQAEETEMKKKTRNGSFALRKTSSYSSNYGDGDDFFVVNFYRFVLIKDPYQEVANHTSFLQDLDIHGRIYLNEQGINAQKVSCFAGQIDDAYSSLRTHITQKLFVLFEQCLKKFSGPSKDALAYVDWLREDFRFSDILVQVSPAVSGHAFPKLKLRYKTSLVQLEGGISHLPVLDPSMRATPLAPSEWRKRLKAAQAVDGMPNSTIGSNYVLLDVRNGYEWDIGHFIGAQRPDTDCFRSTSCGLSHCEVVASDPLSNVDKRRTHVFMYCTGGIRCDVFSTILRKQGFQNLYTLMGGISHYLNKEGPVEWVGNLFVFDDRLSLPPSAYKPDATATMCKTNQGPKNYSFANCYICGSHVRELRHRNCANLDCNLLFLCCIDCVKNLRGCCCLKCTTAPRLRPLLPGNQRYQKWHIYQEREVQRKLTV